MLEHIRASNLRTLYINAHGGEPMLLGPEGLDQLFTELQACLSPHVSLQLGMQTNATLATPAIADTLLKHDVSVGISIDGPRHANRYRVRHDGNDAFNQILEGLSVLQNSGVRITGALAVINRSIPAAETMEFLLDLGFVRVDLLQPLRTHEIDPLPNPVGPTLGEWWAEGFHAWTSSPKLSLLRVRFFEDAIRSVLEGFGFTSEFFGNPPRNYVVVRSDGTYELHDYNKVNGDDGRVLGLNVHEHSMADVLSHAQVRAFHWLEGTRAVPHGCGTCPIVAWCKGGSLSTRYSTERGYDNPSAYCDDLTRFFESLGRWLLSQPSLSAETTAEVSDRLKALALAQSLPMSMASIPTSSSPDETEPT